MNIKSAITAGVVALVVSALVIALAPAKVTQKLSGALASPDIISRYLNVGGAVTEYRAMDAVAATTTPFALDTGSATTTLQSLVCHITRNDAAGATTFDIGIGSTAFATSSTLGTPVSAVALGNTSQVDVATSSTALIIPPNSFIVFKVSTSSLSSNWNISGSKCSATLRSFL